MWLRKQKGTFHIQYTNRPVVQGLTFGLFNIALLRSLFKVVKKEVFYHTTGKQASSLQSLLYIIQMLNKELSDGKEWNRPFLIKTFLPIVSYRIFNCIPTNSLQPC